MKKPVVPTKRRSLLPAAATKRGSRGAPGVGADGHNGWSPVLAVVTDGSRRVLQLVQWVGGTGTPPATAGFYLGDTGLVEDIADATDIRGPAGGGGGGGGVGFTYGSGAPDDGAGADGDWYLDVDTGDWYVKGQVTPGEWGDPIYVFDATLLSIAALGTAADKTIYTTGVDTWAETDFPAFGRSLVASVDAPAAQTTLGLVIGTDVQAWDADLDVWATKTAPSGVVIGDDTYTAADVLAKLLTVDGASSGLDADLLDGHDTSYFLAASSYTAADVLAKLLTVDGSGSGLDADLLDGHDTSFFQAADAELTALAGLTSAADKVPYFTGSGTAALADFTSTARALVDDTSFSAMRTTLGLAIGVNVQAYASILDSISSTGIDLSMFASGVIDTDGTLAANSDSKLATQKAVKTYADSLIAANDAMVFKGAIDCSANPNYPAADAGWTYRISVAGKIGGASGVNVEAGDMIICNTDGTASGNQAAVGTKWNVIQLNIDGALTTANIGSTVQAWDADLDALAGLTSAADKLPYFTGSATAATTDFTTQARQLLDDTSFSAMRTTLGLAIGTDVQAYDPELAALAGLTSAADKVPYFTGSGSAAVADFTSGGRALVALSSATDKLPYFTGSGTASTTDFSSFARTLIDDADSTTARATLGVVIGTNVQAWDADLDALAGLTSAADKLPYFTGTATAALADFTSFARTLVDDADAATMRSTLGLGTAAVKNTGTSGNNVPLLDGSNTWSGSNITFNSSTAVTFNGSTVWSNGLNYPISVTNTVDDGTAAGAIKLRRNRATAPSVDDILGGVDISGNTSTGSGSEATYVGIRAVITSPTSGAEYGRMRFSTIQNHTFAARVWIGGGLYTDGVTGGDEGAGTINAGTLYEAGTSLASKYGALSSANAWTGANTFTLTTAVSYPIELISTDAGATFGPGLSLYRNSASPAANDVIGLLGFNGNDSGANKTLYGDVFALILDPTDGSEDSYIGFQTMVAGASATRAIIGQGIYTPNATGGDKGTDTINTTTYYEAGTKVNLAFIQALAMSSVAGI